MSENPRIARSRATERAMMREAVARTTATEGVSRKLGDDLIDASRELIAAWYARQNSLRQIRAAIAKLESLVGRP